MLVMALGSGFLFPQQTLSDPAYQGWKPGFVDYLFLAFTTATTFSPPVLILGFWGLGGED